MSHRILKGHDPSVDIDPDISGTDFLLQEWDEDGGVIRELAIRPGKDRRDLTWGVPIVLSVTS